MLKIIIAGGRDFDDYALMQEHMHLVIGTARSCNLSCPEIVSGVCRGADALGERYAREHNLPITRFPADWSAYGRSAGPRRNRQMADYADVLVAFWDGKSRGTKHMIDTARQSGLGVHIVQY
ncbi:MAG: DUF2493 domain-containing protein [Candidatus Thermoplasmatota archaeon]|nr:DUF2493 domain-containing protein [Candidatus Thermoplasmatota archaeon]